MGDARFYGLRSFPNHDVDRAQVIERLGGWFDLLRERGWVKPEESTWKAIAAWFQQVAGQPGRVDMPTGPTVMTTPVWKRLQDAEEVGPEGETAWTWPPESERGW